MHKTLQLTAAAAAAALALTLTGCYGLDGSSASTDAAPAATGAPQAASTPTAAAEPAAATPTLTATAAVTGEFTGDQVEFCKLVNASWDAYFGHDDGDLAVAILQRAAAIKPGDFGRFDADTGALKQSTSRVVDRDVRFIDGGPDSQYIEYTTGGCWDWAAATGADLGSKDTAPLDDLRALLN